MSQSVQTLKETVHSYFFFLLLVDSVMFRFPKENMYVQHYMNEGYLHCGILH